MLESLIAICLGVAVILFLIKKRMAAYVLGAIGFTSLAIFQVYHNRPIGLIALILTIGCIERIFTHNRKLKLDKK